MHPKFEKNLTEFRALAKDTLQPRPKISGEETLDIIHEAAKRRETEPHVQARIFEMQIQKQRIMEALKTQLALLDNPFHDQEVPKDAQVVEYKDGGFVTYDAVGNPFHVTLGDLLYDGDWGIQYTCDPKTVPKHVQKRFLVETAKRKIREIYNQQIVKDALASNQVPADRKQSFKWFTETAKREYEPGWIAERLVENIVRKACIDQDLDVHLTPASAFEDVEEKIDFIADRRSNAAGVHVENKETGSGIDRVGIQFTIGKGASGKNAKIERAKAQYSELLKGRNIKNIVLVKMRLTGAQQKYLEWKKDGMPPGGPERLLSDHHRRQILKQIMGTLYEPEELTKIIDHLAQQPANDNAESRDR